MHLIILTRRIIKVTGRFCKRNRLQMSHMMRAGFGLLMIQWLMTLSCNSYAQSEGVVLVKSEESQASPQLRVSEKLEANSIAENRRWTILTRVQSDYYTSPSGLSDQTQSYSSLFLDVLKKFEPKEGAGYGIDFRGRFVSSQGNYPYVSLPEAFLSYSIIEGLGEGNFSLGRRVQKLSELDESWNLGLWQTRFRRDYLHPEIEGNLGVHLTLKNTYAKFYSFLSPMFIPELLPFFQISDGQFKSWDRWFQMPPTQRDPLFPGGQPSEIKYGLNRPGVSDVWGKSSTLVSFVLGDRESKTGAPWLKVQWANKPTPQLGVSYEVKEIAAANPDESSTSVTLHPLVRMHTLVEIDGGYGRPEFHIYGAVIKETLGEPLGRNIEWEPIPRERRSLWGGGVRGQWRSVELDIGILRSAIEREVLKDSIVGKLVSAEPNRFYFTKAFQVGIGAELLRQGSHRLRVHSVFRKDEEENGNWISADLKYIWNRLGVELGMEALTSEAPAGTGFIARTKANDRLRMGLEYVF